MTSKIEKLKEKIEDYLAARYEVEWILSKQNFIKKDGTVFKITWVEGLNGFVIEYAENEYMALKNAYDDGDIFESTDDNIIEKMIKEIEDE